MRILMIALAASFALQAGAARADDNCQLVRAASVDMSFDSNGGVIVPFSVDARPLTLLVDTGGIATMLTQSAIQTLGYPRQVSQFDQLQMYGGQKVSRFIIARNIAFGGLKSDKLVMFQVPDHMLPEGVDGILGSDILRAYDVDFDFAGAKFNLFLHEHCRGQVVYWTSGPVARVPFEADMYGHIVVNVQVDGKDLKGTLDTGASRSYMSLELAESLFGFDDKNPALKPQTNSDGDAYRYPFKTLTMQGLTVNNPDLVLVPNSRSELPPGASRMIVGMGVLRQLHLYVAYGEHSLYVSAASQR